LPDDTWLFRAEIRDGKVHLQGTSSRASALIAGLEASSLLEDVRFASPVTQDGASGRERFHLSALIVATGAGALAGSAETKAGERDS
jgi:general secretion pathway protein L